MHRRGEPFRRLKGGLRLYRPYEARHLDWYVTSPASYSKGEAISHWATQEYINENYSVPRHYDKFYVIKQNLDDETLTVKEIHLTIRYIY